MNASRTARARARAELTSEIKNEARRQLTTVGADRLSLRAVARELGMVSSALYRYFPSREDLLTALIIDAYDSLGNAAEAAAASGDSRQRWRSVCGALRRWAHEHPQEYALIYGSPVPGYQAPQDTIGSARRVPLVLIEILREEADRLAPVDGGPPLSATLDRQARELAAEFAPELSPEVLTRMIIVWTQLFGMISFELFGHLVGSVDPTEDFFDHATELMADFLGLR